MTDIKPVLPRTPVPRLELRLAPDGAAFSLADERPRAFHAGGGLSRAALPDLQGPAARSREPGSTPLPQKGVGVIALSTDNEERANRAKTDWGLPRLRLGYGLSLDLGARMGAVPVGRPWRRPRSASRSRRFSPSRACSWSGPTARSTSPASRPCPSRGRPSPISSARSTTSIAKDYPARGEVATLEDGLAAF